MIRVALQRILWHFPRNIPGGDVALKSERVELSLNSQAIWYLDRLLEMGLYGNTRAEAAKIALFDHCKMLVAEGKMKMAPSLPGSDAVQITEN